MGLGRPGDTSAWLIGRLQRRGGGWYDRRAERVGQQTERPIRSTKTSKRVTSAGEGEGL